MNILLLLVLFTVACGPQKPSEPNSQVRQDTKSQLNESPQSKSKDISNKPVIPQPIAEPAQDIPNEIQELSLIQEPAALSEPVLDEVQLLLNQVSGTYRFKLDVYQKWNHFFMPFNVPVLFSLVPNNRPQAKQLLIFTLSEGRPHGQFCVVQSDFVSYSHEEGFIDRVEARHSISNEGGIVDINNVQNTIIIDNYNPLGFTAHLYGDHGGESVELNVSEGISEGSENFTHDFDSLCRSCGFIIGQNGLCQQKESMIYKSDSYFY